MQKRTRDSRGQLSRQMWRSPIFAAHPTKSLYSGPKEVCPFQKSPHKITYAAVPGTMTPRTKLPRAAAVKLVVRRLCAGAIRDKSYVPPACSCSNCQNGQPPLACETFLERFWTPQALAEHRRLDHPAPDKHVCPECRSAFSSSDALVQHAATHDLRD